MLKRYIFAIFVFFGIAQNALALGWACKNVATPDEVSDPNQEVYTAIFKATGVN